MTDIGQAERERTMIELFSVEELEAVAAAGVPKSRKRPFQSEHEAQVKRLSQLLTSADSRIFELEQRAERAENHVNRLLDALTSSLKRGAGQ